MLHVTIASNCLQVDSIYDEFDGRSVIDLGCGTVSSCCPISQAAATDWRHRLLVQWAHARVKLTLLRDCWIEQGMLAIGAAMLGATHVLAVDCDEDALEVAADNCGAFDGLPVSSVTAHIGPRWRHG